VTPQEEAVIAQTVAAGKLVDAIKMVQAATGASVSEARMAVLMLAGNLPNDRTLQAGIRASLALEDDPRQSAIARAVVIATILAVLVLFAGIVALLAHSHGVRG
jgi:hypothetical protein